MLKNVYLLQIYI